MKSERQAVATDHGIRIKADSTAKVYARPGLIFRPIIDMPPGVIAIGYHDSPPCCSAILVLCCAMLRPCL